jgi:hypothetical protein
MEKAGYNAISELKKSEDGVWRARSIKGRTPRGGGVSTTREASTITFSKTSAIEGEAL